MTEGVRCKYRYFMETVQTFVSSCALARLSTAMAKKTFSSVSVRKAVKNKTKLWEPIDVWCPPRPFLNETETDLTESCQYSLCFLTSHGLMLMLALRLPHRHENSINLLTELSPRSQTTPFSFSKTCNDCRKNIMGRYEFNFPTLSI